MGSRSSTNRADSAPEPEDPSFRQWVVRHNREALGLIKSQERSRYRFSVVWHPEDRWMVVNVTDSPALDNRRLLDRASPGWVFVTLEANIEPQGPSEAARYAGLPLEGEAKEVVRKLLWSAGIRLVDALPSATTRQRRHRARVETTRALASLSLLWDARHAGAPAPEMFWYHSQTPEVTLLGSDYARLMELGEAYHPLGVVEHGFLRVEREEVLAGGTSTSATVISALTRLLAPINAPVVGRRTTPQEGDEAASDRSDASPAQHLDPVAEPDGQVAWPSGDDGSHEADQARSELSEESDDEDPDVPVMRLAETCTHAAVAALYNAYEAREPSPAPVRWGYLPALDMVFLCVEQETFDNLAAALQRLYGRAPEQGSVIVTPDGLFVSGTPSADAIRTLTEWLSEVQAPLSFDKGAVVEDAEAGKYQHLTSYDPDGFGTYTTMVEFVPDDVPAQDVHAADDVVVTLADRVDLRNADALAGLGRGETTTWAIHGGWLLIGNLNHADVVNQLPPASATGHVSRDDDDQLWFGNVAETDQPLVTDYMKSTFALDAGYSD